MDFIKEWGLIAGVAGLGLGVFLVLFREVIRKKIFPMLTKKQGFNTIIIFMILVWSIAAFSMYIYINQPKPAEDPVITNNVTDSAKETWAYKKTVYLKLIELVGKISANSENISTLKELKPEFDQSYEGSMKFAEVNERELLKRMMILQKDYENTLQNKTDFYQRDKLRQSGRKLIDQLHSIITKGDLQN